MIINGGFLAMGTKRVGMARIKSLINENTNQLKRRNEEIISVGAAETKVLTAADSGALVYLGGGGVATATLPAVAAGLNFRFYVTSAQVHIINGGASVIQGSYLHSSNKTGGSSTHVAITNKSSLTLHSSHPAIGDFINLSCNGTNWYADGIVNNALTQG
jgi:hypothetical protein